MTLNEAIDLHAGGMATALHKHLTATGIAEWQELTKTRLMDFRDYLAAHVSPGTAKTYLAVFKAVLNRYEEEGVIPCKDWRGALKAKGDRPVKTFLTQEELAMLEQVTCTTANEQYVKDEFLIAAYTGMRLSDVKTASLENIEGDTFKYTSIKTGIPATIRVGFKTKERIMRTEGKEPLTLAAYNQIIRRLCCKAGIRAKVKTHHGGRDMTGEKWKFVSSHTARISFATNLAILKVGLIDISKMMGHTSVTMTQRYIVKDSIELPSAALSFLVQ